MPNLSIKDVPETWAEALRQQAARNHRSLQGELMAMVEQRVNPGFAAGPTASADNPKVVGYDSRGWPVVRQGSKTAEEVFAQMREQGVKPVRGQPLAVDIIRGDRDAR
jgi:hypothetical protein